MTEPEPGRVIGVDLGEVRVGVAVSDPGRRLAFPLAVLDRAKRADGGEWTALRAIIAEQGASTVVVGLPLRLDGSIGPAARHALEVIDSLRRALPGVEVLSCDERLSTVEAARARRLGQPRREARRRVDDAAAAVVLQAWLDRERR
jgi:putative Holliday junction resolvase